MIDTGRAIALDCHAIGNSIAADDPVGRLFQTRIMNSSVLLKRYQPALETARQPVIVSTLVYFPYDLDNVYDGGESMDYSDPGFYNALIHKISKGGASADVQERIDSDMDILRLINSMHSLDPFMFRSKCEQQNLEHTINSAYHAISAKEWEKIRAPIREKISKLVSKALGDIGGGKENSAREQYVERFLLKIWEAKDIQGIEPFIQAMQIEPARAPEGFFAWKAVCYYQVRFDEVLGGLKDLFRWVGNDQLCFPVDHISLPPEEIRKIREKRDSLRRKMRDGYTTAHRVVSAYEQSYDAFVVNDKPQTFMSFLANAEKSYLLLASHVSVATHSVNLWKWYVEQHGMEMRTTQFSELFEGLATMYGVAQNAEEVVYV